MQKIIKSWLKYFIFVGLFSACINLIYLTVPIYIMIVYDRVLYSFSHATLFAMGVGVLISILGMGVMDYLRRRILITSGAQLVQKVQPFVLKHLPEYKRGFHDLELLRNAIVQGYLFYVFDVIWMLVYLAVLYLLHPLMGVIALGAVMIMAAFHVLLRILVRKRYVVADVAFEANAEFAGTVLSDPELIACMGMMRPFVEKFQQRDRKAMALRLEAEALQSAAGTIMRFLPMAAAVLVFGTGVFVFFKEQISAGAIFAGVLIIGRLFSPLEKSLAHLKASIEAIAAYKRLTEFAPIEKQKEKISLPPPAGAFDAEAISVVMNNRTLLHNISFSLNPGETLGILGPSSAGKTSLCKVLMGIWPAVAGKVRMDKAQIDQWPADAFGRSVGYLPQEVQLFPGSVAENIARLQPVDSEKVVTAAQSAGVHEMILRLPQGYDTKIDETGKNLSAGQRQLISLARAMYDDPRIVVLDEPQTHLDETGLRMLLVALNNLKRDKRTTVMVTDRSGMLANMDKILLIKEGQVAMYGPGRDVLAKLAGTQPPQQTAGA